MTQTIYRCLGLPDQYAGNLNLSGSSNRTFGRRAQRDIWGWMRGYEAMPKDLGLTGVLPEEYFDSQGNRWVKVDVDKIADNKQFSSLGLSGKHGATPSYGTPYVRQVTEKYPPVDENPGVFMVRQGSYYSEMKKNGLIQ